eukprot:Selendium_serpulae@DN1823_c0_g1_i2.p1
MLRQICLFALCVGFCAAANTVSRAKKLDADNNKDINYPPLPVVNVEFLTKEPLPKNQKKLMYEKRYERRRLSSDEQTELNKMKFVRGLMAANNRATSRALDTDEERKRLDTIRVGTVKRP